MQPAKMRFQPQPFSLQYVEVYSTFSIIIKSIQQNKKVDHFSDWLLDFTSRHTSGMSDGKASTGNPSSFDVATGDRNFFGTPEWF
jgi:hypothetical protein